MRAEIAVFVLNLSDIIFLQMAPHTQWRLRHSGVIGKELNTALILSFATFNAPYYPIRFMYGKRTASIQYLILRLMVPKIGNYSQTSFIRTTLFRQEISV